MRNETSACEGGGRTHLNRGRQLSQVLIGSSTQLRLHIEQTRSLICRRVTLSPPCCCGFCSDTASVSRNCMSTAMKTQALDIGKIFDEHVRLEACRGHTRQKFWCKHYTVHNGTLPAFAHSSAQSLIFLEWLKTIMVQGSTTIQLQVNYAL